MRLACRAAATPSMREASPIFEPSVPRGTLHTRFRLGMFQVEARIRFLPGMFHVEHCFARPVVQCPLGSVAVAT
jgi:hypothetical protein